MMIKLECPGCKHKIEVEEWDVGECDNCREYNYYADVDFDCNTGDEIYLGFFWECNTCGEYYKDCVCKDKVSREVIL